VGALSLVIEGAIATLGGRVSERQGMGLKVVRRWFFGLDLLLCRGKVVTVPVQTQGLGSDHGLAARKQPNLTHSELLPYLAIVMLFRRYRQVSPGERLRSRW